MRYALATIVAIGLVFTGIASAQDWRASRDSHARLLELSKHVASGADGIRARLDDRHDRDRIGRQILRSLLTDDADRRDARDPAIERFQQESDELVRSAEDLDRGRRWDNRGEREFIRQFRIVERLAMDVDRVLRRPSARRVMIEEVKPNLLEIRRTLPMLSAYRDREERRDFYRGTADRM